MVISFFSFPSERVGHSVLVALMFSIIISVKGRSTRFKGSSMKRYLFPLMIVLLIGGSLYYFLMARSEFHVSKAVVAKSNGNWRKVLKECNMVNDGLYNVDPMTTPIQWYSGIGNFSLGNHEIAFQNFQAAYDAHPYHLHVLNNLGTAFELKGNHDQAIGYYQKALEVSPVFEDALINLAVVQYNMGNKGAALKTLLNHDLVLPGTKFIGVLEQALKPKFEEKLKDLNPNELVRSQSINKVGFIMNMVKEARENNVPYLLLWEEHILSQN